MNEYAYELPQRRAMYECPIGNCKWTCDDPGLGPGTGGPWVTAEEAMEGILRAAMLAAEAVIREHLETHTLLEWVQEVVRLRDDRAMGVSRAELQQVYEYARHFGVDCDPAMMRVRVLLGIKP